MHKGNLVFVLTFIITYLFLAWVMWLTYSTSSGILAMKRTMQDFAVKYEEDIKNEVFSTIYTNAQKCLSIASPLVRSSCEKQSGLLISQTLKEEELTDKNGYNWPNDLFFVKKSGEQYFRIGWDGHLSNISNNVKTSHLSINQSNLDLLLWNRCDTFGSFPTPQDACELYQTFSLSNGDMGYMVRLYPSVEESWLWLYMLHPIVSFYFIKDFRYLDQLTSFYIFISFLGILLPIIAAVVAKTIYKRRKNASE